MIKINLATLKQADVGSEAGGRKSVVRLDARLDALRELPLRKVGAAIAAAIILSIASSSYQSQELEKEEAISRKVDKELSDTQARLAKLKDFDSIKKALDEDEKMIRTKVETVRKLIAGRQDPPKILLSISSALSDEVWLSDLALTDDGAKLKGTSVGYNAISDFMRNLGDSSTLFADLKLVNTQQERLDAASGGGDIQVFELSAKRRQ